MKTNQNRVRRETTPAAKQSQLKVKVPVPRAWLREIDAAARENNLNRDAFIHGAIRDKIQSVQSASAAKESQLKVPTAPANGGSAEIPESAVALAERRLWAALGGFEETSNEVAALLYLLLGHFQNTDPLMASAEHGRLTCGVMLLNRRLVNALGERRDEIAVAATNALRMLQANTGKGGAL